MVNNEEFYIPQNLNETPRALRAKKDYLALGPARSLDKLVVLYKERKSNGSGTVPTVHRATLARWSGQWGWANLAARYDDYQGDRLLELEAEERKEAFRAQLQQFQQHHNQVGKMAHRATAVAMKDLLDFVEGGHEIKSWDDAVRVAALIRGILPLSDWWGKSLAVSRLINSLDWESVD
jgi:hypothetical protein